MKQNFFLVRKVLAPVLVVLFLQACTSPYISYGVVLWSDNESVIPHGSLAGVIEDSAVKKLLKIELIEKQGTIADIEHWRLKLFNSQQSAKDWIASNQYLGTFATVLKQALPVRDKADRQALMVYRLREQELIKIVGRAEAPSVEGGMENYWYEILTESGTLGWTFGENLSLFTADTALNSGTQQNAGSIDVVARLRGTVWRPKAFVEMIKNRRYDLDIFAPEYGFFIDTNSRTYRIAIEETLLQGTYSSFDLNTETGRYTIAGTDISLAFLPDNTLQVFYTKKNEPKTAEFVSMKDQIAGIVSEEQARRQLILRRISQNGASFVSDLYGSLKFSGNRFTWIGAEALGGLLPSGAGQGGTVSADLYVTEGVSGSFQGALHFRFDGTSDDQAIPFLYNISPLGMDIAPVSPAAVKDYAISSIPADAPIIEFRKAQ